MSTEIKVIYADVESQLGEMKSAVEALNPKAELPITGNVLDVVTKLTTLSTQLETLLTKYQEVVQQNIQTTENSVQFLRESDEEIGSGIGRAVSGGPRPIR
ncbi:YwqI/YxiC family protein [Sporosarcina sp. HYO08]|uniref:YwqI/YxiC family protein n=1 Tax=Sporosarcina sp. HYO08 TaxID=1759557 RepID=UPI000798937C|nr:YwqI/YxiC family protein [Sporosarcina sp. HYO08]KXH78557.1 hypothetical protein AU377_12825 [Sporosarcina sp. HYO08]